MNIAFATHDPQGAELVLPDPSSWTRDTHDAGSVTPSQQGGLDEAPPAYGESRYARIGWDELTQAELNLLWQLADGQVHTLRDLNGVQAFVVFSAPEVTPIPGTPGYFGASVNVEYVWPGTLGTVFPAKRDLPALVPRGEFAPRWAETGGKLSLFYPVSFSPTDGVSGVNPKTDITVKFNLDIDPESFDDTVATVKDASGKPAGGGWTITGDTLTFRTAYGLLPGEAYTVHLKKGQDALRGVNGWYLARELSFSFTTDARGEVVQNSLSFAGFTAVADGIVRNTAPLYVIQTGTAAAPLPSDQPDTGDGAPRVWAEIFFDDELIAGEKAVQVTFLDEFTNYEAPTRVYTRRLEGNSIIIETSAGNFGRLKFVVKAGTVGPIGKRRGRMALDRVFEYNMSQATVSHLRSTYPDVKAVFGRIHTVKPFTAQDGYFFPEGTAPWTRETKDQWVPVTIDLSGPTAYKDTASESGQPSTVPEHIRKLTQPPFQTASLSENWSKWAFAQHDGSAAPPLVPVQTDGVLDVDSVSDLEGHSLTVTFNVPLLDAQVPADALQLITDAGTVPAVGQIRGGQLQVTVGPYTAGSHTLVIGTGGFLRGERGFTPKAEGRYLVSVEAVDGTPVLDPPDDLDLVSISPDASFTVAPNSNIVLTFNAPIDPASLGAITARFRLDNGADQPVSLFASASGNIVTVESALAVGNRTVMLDIQGGPEGLRSGDRFLSEPLIRRVYRTRYAQSQEPPPRSRPAALSGERVFAAWDFQQGPTFSPNPGPWAWQGQGLLVPGGNENNAYQLSAGTTLFGGVDSGVFEEYDVGFGAAALVKMTSPSLLHIDLGNLQMTVDFTGAQAQLHFSLRYLDGTWKEVQRTHVSDQTSASLMNQWVCAQVRYLPGLGQLLVGLGGQTSSHNVLPVASSERPTQGTISGDGLISELVVLHSDTSTDTLEDYFGTL